MRKSYYFLVNLFDKNKPSLPLTIDMISIQHLLFFVSKLDNSLNFKVIIYVLCQEEFDYIVSEVKVVARENPRVPKTQKLISYHHSKLTLTNRKYC